MKLLGVDIGGSGIKGAPVDVKTGVFTKDRPRHPGTTAPEASWQDRWA